MTPPSSNTGGKFSRRNTQPAHVDALAFSFRHEGFSHADLSALCCLLSRFLPNALAAPRRGGWMGFTQSADLSIGGLVAWGGEHQRGRVFVSLMGHACALVTDWEGFAQWLEETDARLSRVDLAYDDLEGTTYPVSRALDDYRAGSFTTGGNAPSFKLIESGSLDAPCARTLYVGKRENGKMCRVYDKGRQLEDSQHPDWVRVELELRAKDRVIPFDVLTNPTQYLAGAYPALTWLSELRAVVRTARRIIHRTLDQLAEWAQLQTGRVMHALAIHHGGDLFAVFDRIKRAELPSRLLGADQLLGAA